MSIEDSDPGLRATGRTYAGLFLVALATLMYEVLLTRIFSVTLYYHFAFVAISVAMFGMTVGAVLVYQLPRLFRPARTIRHMAISAGLFAVTSVVSSFIHFVMPSLGSEPLGGLTSLAPTYLVVAVPFVCSGICICLALTRFTPQVARLYAADLSGAALGCVATVLVLEVTDGPTSVIVVAAVGALGALLFASETGRQTLVRLIACLALGLGLFAAGHSLMVWRQSPWLKLLVVKGKAPQPVLYEKWNSFSRVTVEGNPNVPRRASGWGLSPVYDRRRLVRELNIWIDNTAGTPMTHFSGDAAQVEHLKFDIVNLAHYIRRNARVAAIGSGGGRDLLAAIAFEQRSVVGIEINEAIIDAVNGRFGEFTGHLDRDARVTFVNDEARSWLARQTEPFDIIQISLIDTWAATAAGAFALTENSLYTVEAWKMFLERLTPDGVLTVTRWYSGVPPLEIYRLTSLARASLMAAGVLEPRDHIVLARFLPNTTMEDSPLSVGTMLVSRSPFPARDLEVLQSIADRMRFVIALSPTTAIDENLAALASEEGSDPASAPYPFRMTAPTDDRPFFFHMLPLRNVFDENIRNVWASGANRVQLYAVHLLVTLLAVVVILTLLCIILPLVLTGRGALPAGSIPWLFYFAGIGLGFMLVEISQMQRLIILLGHPSYALSVVLFSLLVFSGLGSLLSERIGRWGVSPIAALSALLVVLSLFGIFTPFAVSALEDAVTPVRILAAGGILSALGLFMGMPFPIGIKLATSSSSASITPWLWGVNGATSVCASVIAMVISLGAGIAASFWAGLASYGLAAVALLWTRRSLRPRT